MSAFTILTIFSLGCVVSWLMAGPMKKIGVSVTVIELIIGFILGNWFISADAAKALGGVSEIGALALFFLVGLHANVSEAKAFKRDIAMVVGIGAIVPLVIIGAIYKPLQLTHAEALFATATIMATGVGVVMRVLQEFRYTGTPSGRFLLACSVIEDFPAILLLSFASSYAVHGALTGEMLTSLGVTFGFGVSSVIIAKLWLKRIHLFSIPFPLLLPAVIVAAWLTDLLGVTSLLGAFLVGLLCKYSDKKDYEGYTQPITDFFIPVFFIMVGMRIKLETLLQPESWLLATALIMVAFISKIVCFMGIRKKTIQSGIDPWVVAFGMVPRGLPGLVFATVALNSGFISDNLFAGLVLMVTVTNTLGLTLLSTRLKAMKNN
ncbi:MAG: Kef-type transport system, rane component [Rickettsiales bacterium]|jgi:Kef-type K+ transport system membrane component KefB|nr:Kef-type transport system, rane component [Rickettsiales bacterium]